MRFFALLILLTIGVSCQPKTNTDGSITDFIRLNQLGFYPQAPKTVVVVGADAQNFHVIDSKTNQVVYTGQLSGPKSWELSGETVQTGSFTEFQAPGHYHISIEGIGASNEFKIASDLLDKALLASLKSNYYQRASMSLEEQYAGIYAREMGHPDTKVAFHSSTGREGFTSSPKGWYDAGDYGKYVVNGAYSLGQMLMLYEQYPTTIGDELLQIPESSNGINDLLDEMRYEMDWLLTMQDEDGGLFFKLTTLNFTGMVMPNETHDQRYIIGKGTASTLDFAAVAAKMARNYPDESYRKELTIAAQKAWEWTKQNPEVAYKNPEDVNTGEYGDSDFSQEWYWAAAELYLLTEETEYLEVIKNSTVDFTYKAGDTWQDYMKYIGVFALIDRVGDSSMSNFLSQLIIEDANRLLNMLLSNDYIQAIDDFQWGSNSDVLNSAIIMAQAYRITGEPRFLAGVHESIDYVFGKNATGYSFVAGYGDKTPMFLHHRPSVADGIAEPIPGFISGGPNADRQDAREVDYPQGVRPMKSWVDVVPSYASNEVCLNWNAPLTYLLGFITSEAQ